MIEDQSRLLADKSEQIDKLELMNECLMMEVDFMKIELNNLGQYGRRNSLRVNNFKLSTPHKDESDLINTMATYLNGNVLADDRPLKSRDIERCHFGQKRVARNRL